MPVPGGVHQQQRPSWFYKMKMGFFVRYCVGMASGAFFGGFSTLRSGLQELVSTVEPFPPMLAAQNVQDARLPNNLFWPSNSDLQDVGPSTQLASCGLPRDIRPVAAPKNFKTEKGLNKPFEREREKTTQTL
ncbi:reactive mitochondrial oxygen species modulator 1 [Holotrichia oblita]|uniref:Reactive mitochondrial oxygen species modulator 1 n=1 Tax=Holotrichia oblita TaxID=644536 RepID=A0ACB9T757_HOLOL|nr:reactive mitochondrial oxygen species modulator 1 [Holotrichia oblita]